MSGEFRDVTIDASYPAWRRLLHVSAETTRLLDRMHAQGWTREEIVVAASDLIEPLQWAAEAAMAGLSERALEFIGQTERALIATRRALAREIAADERNIT